MTDGRRIAKVDKPNSLRLSDCTIDQGRLISKFPSTNGLCDSRRLLVVAASISADDSPDGADQNWYDAMNAAINTKIATAKW